MKWFRGGNWRTCLGQGKSPNHVGDLGCTKQQCPLLPGTCKSWGRGTCLAELGHGTRPQVSDQGMSHTRLGHNTHQNTKDLDLGDRLCRELGGLPLWDCNTHWYRQRAGDGDGINQNGP